MSLWVLFHMNMSNATSQLNVMPNLRNCEMKLCIKGLVSFTFLRWCGTFKNCGKNPSAENGLSLLIAKPCNLYFKCKYSLVHNYTSSWIEKLFRKVKTFYNLEQKEYIQHYTIHSSFYSHGLYIQPDNIVERGASIYRTCDYKLYYRTSPLKIKKILETEIIAEQNKMFQKHKLRNK